ncbi:hypothetical protein AAHA92_33737 [Salvia divinorum]|uniref:Uncharacterized protein n=1 Tax=Salvia divinorum TaxID=28513 RepID=A0ABD1FT89_SALDI
MDLRAETDPCGVGALCRITENLNTTNDNMAVLAASNGEIKSRMAVDKSTLELNEGKLKLERANKKALIKRREACIRNLEDKTVVITDIKHIEGLIKLKCASNTKRVGLPLFSNCAAAGKSPRKSPRKPSRKPRCIVSDCSFDGLPISRSEPGRPPCGHPLIFTVAGAAGVEGSRRRCGC